ncbi:MAG: Hsp33 family molecular chaperone HslO [Gammaproteobacteria bacterium]
MRDNDTIRRFLIENSTVRGQLVHLDASWRAMLQRADYPSPVRQVLGEAVAAVSLLAATLKMDGSITLQITGAGPLKMVVAQATSRRTVRGMARWQGAAPETSLVELTGAKAMVITINPGEGKERYQSVVELVGARLSDALKLYFLTSEQLPTRMWLAADEQQLGGLLLQNLPGEAEDADAWNRSWMKADTLREHELLRLSAREVLHRLYHEEDVRLFEGAPMSFRCDCSTQRVEAMLAQFAHEELREILQEEGEVSVTCEFCAAGYAFDAVDIEQLRAGGMPPASRLRH